MLVVVDVLLCTAACQDSPACYHYRLLVAEALDGFPPGNCQCSIAWLRTGVMP
jgi:hypothetical protein